MEQTPAQIAERKPDVPEPWNQTPAQIAERKFTNRGRALGIFKLILAVTCRGAKNAFHTPAAVTVFPQFLCRSSRACRQRWILSWLQPYRPLVEFCSLSRPCPSCSRSSHRPTGCGRRSSLSCCTPCPGPRAAAYPAPVRAAAVQATAPPAAAGGAQPAPGLELQRDPSPVELWKFAGNFHKADLRLPKCRSLFSK